MQRRIYRGSSRPFPGTRKKTNYVWVRGAENSVGPVSQPNAMTFDLMAKYRTTAGITLNIPEFTIWRIHIRISCQFGLSPAVFSASSAVHHAIFVDAASGLGGLGALNPVSDPYNERFLMYDNYYVSEQAQNTNIPVADPITEVLVSNRVYDIRAHRRFGNLNDTLWLMLTPQGNVEQLSASVTYSILLRQK